MLAKVKSTFPLVRMGREGAGRRATSQDDSPPPQPPPTHTRASDWDQSTIVFKTTAPPRNKTKVAGVTHVGPEFCCGSPAAARTVNAAGRAVAIEAGILTLDAEVREGGGGHGLMLLHATVGEGGGGLWG